MLFKTWLRRVIINYMYNKIQEHIPVLDTLYNKMKGRDNILLS